MRENKEAKGALRLFFGVCLTIIAGGTGRDAELLLIARRQRADADASVGVADLHGAERTLSSRVGLDGVKRRGICPGSRQRSSVWTRFWACRVPASG